MKHEWTAILTLCAVVVVLSAALVRVENQRYALAVGLCDTNGQQPLSTCLGHVETRTSWIWHLYYGLFPGPL